MHDDPYEHASYIDRLHKTGTIFLTDLDGTHATREASDEELHDRAGVRTFLADKEWVAGAITARTPALVMSSEAYEASVQNGYTELQPRCGLDADGKCVYVPPESLPFFAHSQDWDMIGSLGWGMYPRNGKGYLVDKEFDTILNYDHAGYRPKHYDPARGFPPLEEYLPWRQAALAFLADAFPQAREHMSPLEFVHNYWSGVTDVPPLPYRIQLQFEGAEGLGRLRELRSIIDRKVNESDPVALRLALVDESKPNEGRYTVYLMPWRARKESMVNRFVQRSQAAVRMRDPHFKVRDLLYAGDTPTDFRAGLYARGDGPLKFILATGSLLAPYLIERRLKYGEEELDFLWESPKRPIPRLRKTRMQGVYTFKVSTRPWSNLVVIGDERYPKMTPPGSVLAFLEEFGCANNADP